jgi:uncharacterized protein involved in exopolysaccharide biosynthesis
MLTTLIRCYNKKKSMFKSDDSGKIIGFLDARIDSVTASLYQTEARIADYKGKHNLTIIEEDVRFYVEQMKELQTKLLELEAQTHAIGLMNDFIKDPANQYNLIPILLSQGSTGGSEGTSGNPLERYNEVLLERARIIQNSDLSNPLVATLNKQADGLRESVKLTMRNAEKGMELAIQDVKEKEKVLYGMMNSFPEQERDFIELKRQQEIYQGVYLILLQKREETALNGSNVREKARTIDPAFVKAKPVGPRKLYAAIFMFVFTLVVSVGYIFCKEQFFALKEEYGKAGKL